MSSTQIKNKIFKSLEDMDTKHLQSAYQIIKEFANQQKYLKIQVEKEKVNKKKLPEEVSSWIMVRKAVLKLF